MPTTRPTALERLNNWLTTAFKKPASEQPREAVDTRLASPTTAPQLTPTVSPFWQEVDERYARTLPGRRMICPICDRTEVRESLQLRVDQCAFGGGRLERYVCPGCGCIYGPAKYLDLDPAFITADYAQLYTGYAEGDTTVNEIRAFQSLRPSHDGTYLNWGSGGWNQTIPKLRSEGYKVWGYEPSAQPSQNGFILRSKAEITQLFSGLFSNNVIEHLTRPIEEFQYFHSILAPGALMAHATPCYHYAYAFTRFHVIFLTGNSASVLAKRTGFRIVAREEDGDFRNCVFERV